MERGNGVKLGSVVDVEEGVEVVGVHLPQDDAFVVEDVSEGEGLTCVSLDGHFRLSTFQMSFHDFVDSIT